MEAWRKSKYITRNVSLYNVNYFEYLSINSTDIGEIYVNQNYFDRIPTNQEAETSLSQPQDMVV